MAQNHPAYYGYAQNASYNNEILYGGLLPFGSTRLIMGTFPPPAVMDRFEDGHPFFYYNSPRNHYWNRVEYFVPYDLRWKWLEDANESESQNVIRKIDLAIERGWAFMDFFATIDRIVEDNADDANIIDLENVVTNGMLYAALRAMPTINQICCTYKTAFNGLFTALFNDGYACLMHEEPFAADGYRYTWEFEGRIIEIVLLYPASRSRHSRDLKNQQYEFFLG